MHRTRHSSLDYLGGGASSQEQWSEFLSTSMMALSTAEPQASPPPPGIASPSRRRQHPRQAKPRGMSMGEAMSPPPLPADAWRPLGRRVASPPPTLTRSSSSSPESASSADNQAEHLRAVEARVTVMSTSSATFGRLGSSSSLRDADAKLKHAASFRGVVSSCLSSSGSSFYDSSSSDEEQQQEAGSPLSNQLEGGVPAPPPVDPSYAESCLPVLSQLPRPPRSISVDSGSGARAGSLAHVKSPVLGNRKDAQTWQLQDEEFLMTSPRFGASLGRDGGHVNLFHGNSVGSLLSTYVAVGDGCIGDCRLTKDSRASSVDFTLGRSHEVNPPLPPPQEPLQRLRARSFSYSATYGSSGYNPFNKQQYAPPSHHQQHLQQQQQAMGQEFPQTLRSFHAGSGMMQPGQPQPPPAGIRPPRVSIPTDSPMHQYQYGPPMPYRRYSDAFAMPPYPDSYNGEQQENQSRQGNTGRGMRSYSVEYGNYPSTRTVRSQSMEGPQLFASAPPMEYPPSLSRSNSAGVAFDWGRGRMDSAPPLPPDVRPGSGNGSAHYPPPPPEAYYDVEFKRGRQEVEADRGEDIGRIVQRTTDVSKVGSGNDSGSPGEESMGRGKRHDLPTKKIICVASQRECEMLNEQRKEEHEVFEVCKSKVRQRLLPMNVIDAEYQFDRHKLTFFFEADRSCATSLLSTKHASGYSRSSPPERRREVSRRLTKRRMMPPPSGKRCPAFRHQRISATNLDDPPLNFARSGCDDLASEPYIDNKERCGQPTTKLRRSTAPQNNIQDYQLHRNKKQQREMQGEDILDGDLDGYVRTGDTAPGLWGASAARSFQDIKAGASSCFGSVGMRDFLREVDEERGETANRRSPNAVEATAGQGRYVVPFTMSREEEAVGMELARSLLPQLMEECAPPSSELRSELPWTRVKPRKKSTGVILWEKRSDKAKRESKKKKWGSSVTDTSAVNDAYPSASVSTREDTGPVTYSVRSSTTVDAPLDLVLKTLDSSVATAHRSFTRIIYGNLVADTSVLFHSSTHGTDILAENESDSFDTLAVRWFVCRCSNPMISDCDFCLQEFTKRHSIDELEMNSECYNNNMWEAEDDIHDGGRKKTAYEGLHSVDEVPMAYKLFRSMETRHCPELLESHRVVRCKVPLGGFLMYPTDSSDRTDVVFYMNIAQDKDGDRNNRSGNSALHNSMLTQCSDRQFRALQNVARQMAMQIGRLKNAVESYKMSLHLESLRTLQWVRNAERAECVVCYRSTLDGDTTMKDRHERDLAEQKFVAAMEDAHRRKALEQAASSPKPMAPPVIERRYFANKGVGTRIMSTMKSPVVATAPNTPKAAAPSPITIHRSSSETFLTPPYYQQPQLYSSDDRKLQRVAAIQPNHEDEDKYENVASPQSHGTKRYPIPSPSTHARPIYAVKNGILTDNNLRNGNQQPANNKMSVSSLNVITRNQQQDRPLIYRGFETLQLYEDILLKLCENAASVRNSKFVALTLFTRANPSEKRQQNEVEAGEAAVYYLKVKGNTKLMKIAANMRCCDPVLQLHKSVVTRNTWALNGKSTMHPSGFDFRQLPIVMGPQQARFYAGVPLTDTKKRYRYGALAVFDAATNPGEDDDLPMSKTLQALRVCAREAVIAIDERRKELELRSFLQAPLIQLRQSEPALHLSMDISQSSPRWKDIVQGDQESVDGDSDDNDDIDEAQRRLEYELRNARMKSGPEFPSSGNSSGKFVWATQPSVGHILPCGPQQIDCCTHLGGCVAANPVHSRVAPAKAMQAEDVAMEAAPPTPALPEEEMPFSEEELATTFKVLDALAKRKELLEQRNMRMLRKKLAPVSEYMEGRKFGGVGRKKYLEDKAIREEKRARHNQRKMHDKRHINASALRRERIAKLESLLQQGKDEAVGALPMIADGVAGEDVCHSTATLTNGPEPELQKLCTDEAEQAKEEKAAAEKKEASALLGFRSCYTCKSRFDKIHHFYDQLCPRCAELNFSKRFQSADLRGKVALITGARVKIGFQAAVKLLLAGAAVIATTRFPKDAAERFAKHPEYETFKDRLQIFGIDFRDLVHLEQFCDFVISRYSRLDMIVHNACQTVRRPPTYYKPLVDKETKALEASTKEVQLLMNHQQEFESHVKSLALPASLDGKTVNAGGDVAMSSALKSQVPLIAGEDHPDNHAEAFPEGLVDVNGQQVDLRSRNSWLLRLGEVATPEVAEVFAINTLAPFIMNNRLVTLLEKSGSTEKKFIVNVSAMEGKFYRYKTPNHPHTNMAKAALNMMTRTCAEDLSKRRIYMNSVDTGWINDENPLVKAHAHAQAHNFQTPIDEIDAAARVLDPIFVGYNSGETMFGKFLKDFHETEW
ncbi:unnamed protein product [Phytophthora lilii]|uniref:Unnamed protein product n=1 Tax=Phytophthora lilii TaxID=2077276 RepID=A0A9W6TIP3_9STRA|nr:unnamed protein product [Phytophthora lilii]